jgi:hypothetical protein
MSERRSGTRQTRVVDDLLRMLRLRKPRPEPIGEAEAYERAYGERRDVRRLKLPPRQPRYSLPVSGEELRRRFEQRLSERDGGDG